MEDEKVCKLINGKFSWRLEVDDQVISFNGSYNTEYFATHYRNLGYMIFFKDENKES